MPHYKGKMLGERGFFWSWEEAFSKFGFADGDGNIQTHQVVAVLKQAGYEVSSHDWGCHNHVIDSIKQDGRELIPHDDDSVFFGYDDPRGYLPADIVSLLDEKLPAEGVQFIF